MPAFTSARSCISNFFMRSRAQPTKIARLTRTFGILFIPGFFCGIMSSAGPALSDDFNELLSRVQAGGTVSTLVTGWQAITGDNIFQSDEQARASGNYASITGDEFVKKLSASSGTVTVSRQYENFSVMAIEMDASALREAKAYSSNVQVWEDPVLEFSLSESTRMVRSEAAWNAGFTGKGLAVVVIDDGVDRAHPFIGNRVVMEACFADVCPNGKNIMVGEGAASPRGTHGTHVAGIVMGSSRTERLTGIGPDLTVIAMMVANKDVSKNGPMNGSGILAALDAVITISKRQPNLIGAVNMSLYAERPSKGICRSGIWDQVAAHLQKLNIPVAVASGNGSKSNRASPVGFPACIDGFVSVGAVTKTGRITSFSNSGPTLDVLAPGDDIRSSTIEVKDGRLVRGFQKFPGTSMAAPHVAGAFALLKQASPDSSVAELLAALKRSGTQVRDPRNGISAPLINVGAAIAILRSGSRRQPSRPAPTPPAPKPEPPVAKPSPPAVAPTPAPPPRARPNPPANTPSPPAPAPRPKQPKEQEKKGWNSITG
jgi:subtilisin family serine protease